MHLARFPRVRFAHLPTPLEPMPNLTRLLGGPALYVKRDDCTGLATGGNKTRKLEFLIGDALAKGADTLITHGAVQSNHVRQTAAAACRYGLRCEALLERRVAGPRARVRGDRQRPARPAVPGASCASSPPAPTWTPPAPSSPRRCARRGGRPYYIPGGGSNAVGALGYVNAGARAPAAGQRAGSQDRLRGRRHRQHRHPGGPGLRARGRQQRHRRARHLRAPARGAAGSRRSTRPRARPPSIVGLKAGIDARAGDGERRLCRRGLRHPDRRHARGDPARRRDRGPAARPGLHRQGHGRPDRPLPPGLLHARTRTWSSCTPAARRRCSPTRRISPRDAQPAAITPGVRRSRD